MKISGTEFSKSTCAIAAVLDYANLQTTLLELLVHHTQAQYACLLSYDDTRQEFMVTAKVNTLDMVEILTTPLPMQDSADSLPLNILKAVQHTNTGLVIGSAIYHPLYRHDPYIEKQQPMSIMSLPINCMSSKHANTPDMTGMVYLENKQTAAVFESKHFDIAQYLCLHAAIAINNIDIVTRLHEKIQRLEQRLRDSNILDKFTEVANRDYFDTKLEQEWRRLARDERPISILLCQLERLPLYQQQHGEQALYQEMKRAAQHIQKMLHRPADLVARYDDSLFIILLPSTDNQGALHIAQMIQTEINRLHWLLAQDGKPAQHTPMTMRMGVASVTACRESLPEAILAVAEDLLKTDNPQTNQIYVDSF